MHKNKRYYNITVNRKAYFGNVKHNETSFANDKSTKQRFLFIFITNNAIFVIMQLEIVALCKLTMPLLKWKQAG